MTRAGVNHRYESNLLGLSTTDSKFFSYQDKSYVAYGHYYRMAISIVEFSIQFYSCNSSSNSCRTYDLEHILKYNDLGKDFKGVLKDGQLFVGKIRG